VLTFAFDSLKLNLQNAVSVLVSSHQKQRFGQLNLNVPAHPPFLQNIFDLFSTINNNRIIQFSAFDPPQPTPSWTGFNFNLAHPKTGILILYGAVRVHIQVCFANVLWVASLVKYSVFTCFLAITRNTGMLLCALDGS
jgi:hypothetical protein